MQLPRGQMRGNYLRERLTEHLHPVNTTQRNVYVLRLSAPPYRVVVEGLGAQEVANASAACYLSEVLIDLAQCLDVIRRERDRDHDDRAHAAPTELLQHAVRGRSEPPTRPHRTASVRASPECSERAQGRRWVPLVSDEIRDAEAIAQTAHDLVDGGGDLRGVRVAALDDLHR